MEMKKSDLLDRWTILLMKEQFDETAKQELALYDEEVVDLVKEHQNHKYDFMIFMVALIRLMEANAKIWENEAAIRREYDNDPSSGGVKEDDLVEVGRRALAIREHNRQRIKAKTMIDNLFGQLPDKKVNHASQ